MTHEESPIFTGNIYCGCLEVNHPIYDHQRTSERLLLISDYGYKNGGCNRINTIRDKTTTASIDSPKTQEEFNLVHREIFSDRELAIIEETIKNPSKPFSYIALGHMNFVMNRLLKGHMTTYEYAFIVRHFPYIASNPQVVTLAIANGVCPLVIPIDYMTENCIAEGIKARPSQYNLLPTEYKKSKKIAMAVASINGSCLLGADKSIFRDAEIAKIAIMTNPHCITNFSRGIQQKFESLFQTYKFRVYNHDWCIPYTAAMNEFRKTLGSCAPQNP